MYLQKEAVETDHAEIEPEKNLKPDVDEVQGSVEADEVDDEEDIWSTYKMEY